MKDFDKAEAQGTMNMPLKDYIYMRTAAVEGENFKQKALKGIEWVVTTDWKQNPMLNSVVDHHFLADMLLGKLVDFLAGNAEARKIMVDTKDHFFSTKELCLYGQHYDDKCVDLFEEPALKELFEADEAARLLAPPVDEEQGAVEMEADAQEGNNNVF